jgi:hypothetical protein
MVETCKKDRNKCTIEDYNASAQPTGYSRCTACKTMVIDQPTECNYKVYIRIHLNKPVEFW